MPNCVYGSATLPDTLDLETQSADLTLLGDGNSDNLGGVVAGGDINGDGFADVIAGARRADSSPTITNTGKTYVVYGDSTFAAADTLDISSDADVERILVHDIDQIAGLDTQDQIA